MEFHVVIPVLISFAISLVLGPIVIPFLRRLKMGQTERELGVQLSLIHIYGWYHGLRWQPCRRRYLQISAPTWLPA